MKTIDKNLDRKACEVLASRLKGMSIFRGKSLAEIASEIPKWSGFSRIEGAENGIASRAFAGLFVTVYDLKKHRKIYTERVAEMKKSLHHGRLPSKDKFSCGLLDFGYKSGLAYILEGRVNEQAYEHKRDNKAEQNY